MIIFPASKINLGLKICGKRPDGYHDLKSIFCPLELSDILEIIPSNKFEFSQSGIPVDGDQKDNIIIKAYELLKSKFDLEPVKIHLHKVVPLGAGLGGGSANGTACLKLLNTLFDLKLSKDQLLNFALELGSDCPFFVESKLAYVEGRGERLRSIEHTFSNFYIKLINPGIHISTAQAFKGIPINTAATLNEAILQKTADWKNEFVNDFEKTVFPLYPELESIKKQLYSEGAFYASLSGTGSTVYGIFKEEPSPSFPQYFEWIHRL